MRRVLRGWSLFGLALAGCWSDESINGFTPDQWAALQLQFAQPSAPPVCTGSCASADLGQALFFEPALSSTHQVACTTCHDPGVWFVDTRRENSVSLGVTKWTAHNSISLANVGLKNGPFTWTGDCGNRDCAAAIDVITDIALPRAMGSSPAIVAGVIRNGSEYRRMYNLAYGSADDPDTTVFANVVDSFGSYMRQLVSLDSPFDGYIEGGPLDEAARRGFTLFVGKAMCIECHRGPLLTDLTAHVTGVRQVGDHAPTIDVGRAGTGAFITPSLRNVAITAPYMHDGSLRTLKDVVDFYRWGGATAGFIGDKDRLMQPLDITDDDAHDLEAFLQTLTGAPIDPRLTEDHHVPPGCALPMMRTGLECGGSCIDVSASHDNCGACGHACASTETCVASTCTP